MNPFRLTEAETKSVTVEGLCAIVALPDKALAFEKEMDRELNEQQTDVIIKLEEQSPARVAAMGEA